MLKYGTSTRSSAVPIAPTQPTHTPRGSPRRAPGFFMRTASGGNPMTSQGDALIHVSFSILNMMKSLSFRPRCRARGWCSSVRTGLGSCPPRSALPLILPSQPKQLQFLPSFLSICLSPLPSYRSSPLASRRVLAAFLLFLQQN